VSHCFRCGASGPSRRPWRREAEVARRAPRKAYKRMQGAMAVRQRRARGRLSNSAPGSLEPAVVPGSPPRSICGVGDERKEKGDVGLCSRAGRMGARRGRGGTLQGRRPSHAVLKSKEYAMLHAHMPKILRSCHRQMPAVLGKGGCSPQQTASWTNLALWIGGRTYVA